MAATVAELGAALAAADKAGDADGARRLAAAITHMQDKGLKLYAEPEKKMGFIDSAVEAVTGEKRKTDTTESLPDWASMPELNSLSLASAKTGVGTLLSSPKETAQIIKANYPQAQVRQDEKGNWVIKSAVDGQEYAIKPGFQVSDIPRALGALVAFTPAGRAATIPGMAAASAGTQAVIEASQAATGGEFNPKEVAIAGAVGAAVPAVVTAVKALKQPAAQALERLTGKPVPGTAEIPPVGGATPPPAASPGVAAPVTPAAPMTPPAAPIAPVVPMAADELTQTAKTAASGGMGSTRATEILAAQAAPDAKTLAAAERLGIQDYLQPDHVTTNQAYRELAQAVKSVPGSATRTAEIEGLNAIGKKADDLIDAIGGTTDVSALNAKIKSTLQTTQGELDKKAETLYGQLRKAIPPQTEAPAPSVLSFVEQRAKDLGGPENLTPLEKTILKKLSPKEITDASGTVTGVKQPTYTLLDDVRRDLGSAGKMTGPFKDADVGLAKKLYGLLSTDQGAVAEANGVADLWSAAKGAVQVRKGVEDDLKALFGKTLSDSIVGDLSNAVKSLPSGDPSRLIRLLKATPESMRQELVATGLNTAFGKQVQNGALNFNTYARWFGGLLENKQSYAAVMSNLPPQARKQLSDLYRVSKGVSMATRERITTGRIQAITQEFQVNSLIDRIYNTAGWVASSAISHIISPFKGGSFGITAAVDSALTQGGKTSAIKAADTLLGSPEFVQMAKAAGTPAAKEAAARLAYSRPFTKFVRAVGAPKELSNRERWILQTLEAQNQTNQRN